MLFTLKRACDSGRKIVVFGAGELGGRVVEILKDNDITIHAVCDNDVKKQLEIFHNYKVLPANAIQDIDPIVVVATVYVKEIVRQLNDLGIETIIPYKELFLKLHESYNKLVFPRCVSPTVSIVLTAYNEWRYTYECLKSILSTKTNVEYEVIVGDNASEDETKDIEQYVENITVVHYKENIGYLRNCNETAKAAKGKYTVLLSNDVKIISDYWLDSWVEIFERDQLTGVVGGSCYEWDLETLKYGASVDDAVQLIDNEKLNGNCVVGYVSPACICFRSDVWAAIGGYDERYMPAWWEDLDLYCTMRKLGYKVVMNAETPYVHYGEVTAVKENEIIRQNLQKFKDKWSDNWQYVVT